MAIKDLLKLAAMGAVAYFTPTKVDDVAVGMEVIKVGRNLLAEAHVRKAARAALKEGVATNLLEDARLLKDDATKAASIHSSLLAATPSEYR